MCLWGKPGLGQDGRRRKKRKKKKGLQYLWAAGLRRGRGRGRGACRDSDRREGWGDRVSGVVEGSGEGARLMVTTNKQVGGPVVVGVMWVACLCGSG